MNAELNISGIRKFLADHFSAGAYFATQLMPDEINVLDRLSEQHNSIFEQQIKHLVVCTSLNSDQLRQVLSMLQQHHYIELQESILPTEPVHYMRLKIIDNVFCSMKIGSKQDWMNAEEWAFEDVVRALLTQHQVYRMSSLPLSFIALLLFYTNFYIGTCVERILE